jgi:hypothetical protein
VDQDKDPDRSSPKRHGEFKGIVNELSFARIYTGLLLLVRKTARKCAGHLNSYLLPMDISFVNLSGCCYNGKMLLTPAAGTIQDTAASEHQLAKGDKP